MRFYTATGENAYQSSILGASPSTTLHLRPCRIYCRQETDGNDGILFKNSAGTQKGIGTIQMPPIGFNVNESERMRHVLALGLEHPQMTYCTAVQQEMASSC